MEDEITYVTVTVDGGDFGIKIFDVDEKINTNDFKKRIAKEFGNFSLDQITFLDKILDTSDNNFLKEQKIFHVVFDDFLPSNAKPKDLLNRIKPSHRDKNRRRIFVEIPQKYYDKPLSCIPLPEILSNIVIGTQISEPESEYTLAPNYRINPVHYIQNITSSSREQKSSREETVSINVLGIDIKPHEIQFPLTSGMITGKNIREKIQEKHSGLEIKTIFLKQDGQIEKIDDDKLYNLKGAVNQTEIIFTSPFKLKSDNRINEVDFN